MSLQRVAEFDQRRVLVFLAFAFVIAWATGLVVYLTGGLTDSPTVFAGLSLWVVLVSTGYMFAPAAANVLTRLVTGEGFADLGLRPHFRRAWRWWVVAWLAPPLLTLVGVALFYGLFPQNFDSSLAGVTGLLGGAGVEPSSIPGGVWGFVALQVVQAVVLAPFLNGLFTLGEEFGWRAYLLPKLVPLGWRRAVVVLGVVWGVWHWPVVAMGYNYGFDYPVAPWLGMLVMVVFTFAVGTLLAWLTLRADSVWPAVIGHAAVNGIGAIGLLFVQGQPSSLLGPAVTGLVVGLPWLAVALWLVWRPGSLSNPAVSAAPDQQL